MGRREHESPHVKLKPVDPAAVRWTDGFWADRFRLCRAARPAGTELIDVSLVPYYAWGNRGVGEMSVWLPAW